MLCRWDQAVISRSPDLNPAERPDSPDHILVFPADKNIDSGSWLSGVFHLPEKWEDANLFPAPWIITHMATGILDGTQSLISPLLKALVTVLFAAGTVLFYQAYLRYGGNLKKITLPLVISGIAGTLAAIFWWAGDLFAPWKWAESAFFVLFAIFMVLGSFHMYTYLKEIALVFAMTTEEE